MKRKIYVCPKCGKALNFSDNPEYTFQCFDCDEDFYSFEAKEMEQPRIEGIVDYTELAKASMKVREITEATISSRNREIAIKGASIIEQIAEYINETLRPIFDSGVYKESNFRNRARINAGSLNLGFADYLVQNKPYYAQLYLQGSFCVYFNAKHKYIIEYFGSNENIRYLVTRWPDLKKEMNTTIPYAIQECDRLNLKKLEKQKEMAEVINSFRL